MNDKITDLESFRSNRTKSDNGQGNGGIIRYRLSILEENVKEIKSEQKEIRNKQNDIMNDLKEIKGELKRKPGTWTIFSSITFPLLIVVLVLIFKEQVMLLIP